MSETETRVREAAQALHDAIVAARAEGFKVELPHQVPDLPRIAVSAGRKAMTPEEIGKAAQAEAERLQKPQPAPAPASAVPQPEVADGHRGRHRAAQAEKPEA